MPRVMPMPMIRLLSFGHKLTGIALTMLLAGSLSAEELAAPPRIRILAISSRAVHATVRDSEVQPAAALAPPKLGSLFDVARLNKRQPEAEPAPPALEPARPMPAPAKVVPAPTTGAQGTLPPRRRLLPSWKRVASSPRRAKRSSSSSHRPTANCFTTDVCRTNTASDVRSISSSMAKRSIRLRTLPRRSFRRNRSRSPTTAFITTGPRCSLRGKPRRPTIGLFTSRKSTSNVTATSTCTCSRSTRRLTSLATRWPCHTRWASIRRANGSTRWVTIDRAIATRTIDTDFRSAGVGDLHRCILQRDRRRVPLSGIRYEEKRKFSCRKRATICQTVCERPTITARPLVPGRILLVLSWSSSTVAE